MSATLSGEEGLGRLTRAWRSLAGPPQDTIRAALALFALSVLAFSAGVLLGPNAGVAGLALAVLGGTTCGWSWLLTRAVFATPTELQARWPALLVAGMVATSLVAVVLAPMADGAPPIAGIARMAQNTHALASSTVLLLALIEPLRGLRDPANAPDRRFRITFASGYAALLLVSVVWPREAGAGTVAAQASDAVRLVSAWLALIGAAVAVAHRRRQSRAGLPEDLAADRPEAAVDPQLQARVVALMADAAVTGDPDMKVPRLAQRLRAPEYKVSRAIRALGFANFNQMINHHRLARAKAMLADTAHDDDSILAIAMACGFGSIGPFNRAFKADAGVTPSQFRAAARGRRGAAP